MKLALVGKMHSGKGEVASRLIESFGFTKMAFADPVKDASVDAFNALYKYLGKPQTMTREILEKDKSVLRPMPQFVGTKFGRDYLGDPDIWVNKLLQKIGSEQFNSMRSGSSLSIVVDDCRFVNEAEALRDVGFSIVRLFRSEEDRFQSVVRSIMRLDPNLSFLDAVAQAADMMRHPSEMEVDLIEPDHVINNYHSLEHLDVSVGVLVQEELNRGPR